MRTKDIKLKILRYFFLHPTERLRVRQIERQVGVPLPSAIRYARELEREGFLQREQLAGVTLFSADRASPRFVLEKRCFNLRALHDSWLLQHLIRAYDNPPIVLFGSYARGEDVESSDIDLFVQTPANIGGLRQYEQRLGRKIHVFSHANLKKIGNPELANSIINGITLNGFIEILT